MHVNSDRKRGRRWPNSAIATLAAFLLSSCAHQPDELLSQVAVNAEVFGVPTEYGVAACRESLAVPKVLRGPELDAGNIRLVNWNIQKRRHENSGEYLVTLGNETDLVLVQEASLRHETINELDSSKHWSFAPGYMLDGEITGVMTLSRTRPLTQCSFVSMEPLLRTPKATSITEYGLSSTDETLVVVNIHAVNFSMGTGAYRDQFEQVRAALSEHSGPIILSGDFNTWRRKRQQIVEDVALALGLESVSFGDHGNDRRTRVFGRILDHVYVRGLSPVIADTEVVETSDHNPMSATLTMWGEEGIGRLIKTARANSIRSDPGE